MVGVEKTLLDLLSFLCKTNKFDIELFLFENEGVYLEDIKQLGITVYSFDEKTQNYMKPYKQNIKNMIKNTEIIKLIKYIMYIIISICDLKYYKYSIGNKVRFRLIDKSNIKLNNYDISVAYSGRHLLYFNNRNVNSKNKYTYIHGDVCDLNFTIEELKEEYCREDKIVCVSNKCKKSFLKKLPQLQNKCVVINNLMDFKEIDILKDETINNFDDDKLNIVSVGRLSKEKNYLYLLKILKKIVKNQKIPIKLYIIGDGPERKKLNKYIVKNSLDGVISLEGYQKNPYKYIQNAMIYIQPSKSEGFCLTIYEAYYLKKIILTNDVADVKYLITNNYDGFIASNNIEFENYLKKLLTLTNKELNEMKNNIKNINNTHTKKMIIELYGGD